MVDFSLSDTERQVRDTVRSFIAKEVMPLEPEVLRNERSGRPGLEAGVIRDLQLKARKSGFWGVNTPEEYGGMESLLDEFRVGCSFPTRRRRALVPFDQVPCKRSDGCHRVCRMQASPDPGHGAEYLR